MLGYNPMLNQISNAFNWFIVVFTFCTSIYYFFIAKNIDIAIPYLLAAQGWFNYSMYGNSK